MLTTLITGGHSLWSGDAVGSVIAASGVELTASTGSTAAFSSDEPWSGPEELETARQELRIAQSALQLLDPSDVASEDYLIALGRVLDWAERVDISRHAGVLAQNLAAARSVLADETTSYGTWSRLAGTSDIKSPVPVPERFVRSIEVDPVEVYDFGSRMKVRELMA